MPNTYNIGKNIKTLRKMANISQETLAALMGINTETLTDYENGNTTHMKVSAIKSAEDLFQTNIEELSEDAPSNNAIDTAQTIAKIRNLDNDTLDALINIGRIANNIKEMQKLSKN